ncbi:mitochondrial protein [Suillus paluster]|uniref:mitochondrial protein n=1 Tax=Suillus paluster TaxID=48578 RepID=UPI001B85C7DB|nr:mitochondrial protein [Suillus paluster]KAG1735267.1 mitochondrial protein [Suillus paluster]
MCSRGRITRLGIQVQGRHESRQLEELHTHCNLAVNVNRDNIPMSAVAQKNIVVGGNGFVGSAVCKLASCPENGGHQHKLFRKTLQNPKQVEWRKADALNLESYADILPSVDAVVHTIGTLLDNTQHKQRMQEGDVMGMLKSLAGRGKSSSAEGQRSAYDTLNYETAVRMCEAFIVSEPVSGISHVRPFIYVSAEDVNRPIVSVRYLETKREAEKRIEEIIQSHPQYRGVYVRSNLTYHPHVRPMTTIPATIFDVSARIHAAVPTYIPMPSSDLRWLGTSVCPDATDKTPSALTSMANLLSIPQSTKDIRGVVGVRDIRHLIGLSQMGAGTLTPST